MKQQSMLRVGKLGLPLEESQYKNDNGFWKIVGTEFHILKQHIRYRESNIDFRFYEISGEKSAASFVSFYDAWQESKAFIYRGVSGNHFAYDRIKRSPHRLKSEGDHDIPTFTMDNAKPTRWLPGDNIPGQCVGIAIGNNSDTHTSNMIKQSKDSIAIGIVVKMTIGADLPFPVAYMNAGEQLVQGPLDYPHFKIHSLVWDGPQLLQTLWPDNLNPSFLMPTRPYKPSEEQIAAWKDKYLVWRSQIKIAEDRLVHVPSPLSPPTTLQQACLIQ